MFVFLANDRGKNGGTVILNVGGKIHQVRWETIDKFPKSRLQRIRYATSEGFIAIGAIEPHYNVL